MWTEREHDIHSALRSTVDTLQLERKHNTHTERIQTQLTRAQTDIARLRRDNADLDLHLRELRTIRADLHERLDQKCQEADDLAHRASDERAQLHDLLAQERANVSAANGELEHANARIRELVAKVCSPGSLSGRSREQLAAELSQSDSRGSRTDNLGRTIELGSQRLDSQRVQAIRQLVYLVLLLHGFCLHLGQRLAPALRSNDSMLARWRVLSAQKVEAKRALVRHLYCNHDLQQEIHRLYTRQEDLEKEALMYRGLYSDSVKARDAAARKFKKFCSNSISRQSTTITRVLTGLLVLWRMNLILSGRLAQSRNTVRTAPLTGVPRYHRVTYADASIQCSSDDVPMLSSKKLVDASAQHSPEKPHAPHCLTCASAPPSPSPAAGFDATRSKPDTVRTFGTIPITSDDLSGITNAAPLRLRIPTGERPASPATATPKRARTLSTASTMRTPDASHAELAGRVQRLVQKFDAFAAVHCAYRELLLQKTRPLAPPPPAVAQKPAPVLARRRSLAASIHAS